MDAESVLWDELADRLVVLYNKQKHLRSDIEQWRREIAKAEASLVENESLCSQYEALLAPGSEQGIPA